MGIVDQNAMFPLIRLPKVSDKFSHSKLLGILPDFTILSLSATINFFESTQILIIKTAVAINTKTI